MEGTSSSSCSSSCASFGSFDDVSVRPNGTVKFLCSYAGKILPRYPDAKLRYVGGQTRVLSVDRSLPFSELQAKMGELCGWGSISLRCQLPTEDLDALISITSDEDLANLYEEYDLASRDHLLPLKIRAFLYPAAQRQSESLKSNGKFLRRAPISRFSGRSAICVGHGQGSQGHHHQRQYLVHHGSHWQQ